jgi:hypothetical protein
MSNNTDPTEGTELNTDAVEQQKELEKIKQAEMPTRKVKMMMVNPADFMFLFTKGMTFRKHTKLIEGLPADAQLIALAADSVRNGIMLVVQSESYEPVRADTLPPVELVRIQTGVIGATKKKASKRKK